MGGTSSHFWSSTAILSYDLLDQWEDSSLVPALLNAYTLNVQAEQYLPNLLGIYALKQVWYHFQEAVMRLLGRKGALGVLAGIRLPPIHLKHAIVNLALGFCQFEKRNEDFEPLYNWQKDAPLIEELKGVARQRFELSEDEMNEYLGIAEKGYAFQWRLLNQDK